MKNASGDTRVDIVNLNLHIYRDVKWVDPTL